MCEQTHDWEQHFTASLAARYGHWAMSVNNGGSFFITSFVSLFPQAGHSCEAGELALIMRYEETAAQQYALGNFINREATTALLQQRENKNVSV